MDRSHITDADDRRQLRSPFADGDGWINPRRGRWRISATSRGRGRISASSRGRGRISSDSRRISAGFRRRSRDDEGLIHHLWSYISRSSIGEPAGSVGDSPVTGGVTGGEGDASLNGGVDGGEGSATPMIGVAGGADSATPTRYVAGGEGGASPTGGLAGGEGDATFEESSSPVSPVMSDEEFMRRFVVTEADKVLWEKSVLEADREVKALFGENCLDP
ncbi:hypothetical protein AAHA92_30133 [Salvia divinorum]|uniref:Uncharacterized protein n=1 Tax=Salvia divinorum TaxID=28513 RepID=A0ABD1G0M0_SALDI